MHLAASKKHGVDESIPVAASIVRVDVSPSGLAYWPSSRPCTNCKKLASGVSPLSCSVTFPAVPVRMAPFSVGCRLSMMWVRCRAPFTWSPKSLRTLWEACLRVASTSCSQLNSYPTFVDPSDLQALTQPQNYQNLSFFMYALVRFCLLSLPRYLSQETHAPLELEREKTHILTLLPKQSAGCNAHNPLSRTAAALSEFMPIGSTARKSKMKLHVLELSFLQNYEFNSDLQRAAHYPRRSNWTPRSRSV
jgi:hypothetical protein